MKQQEDYMNETSSARPRGLVYLGSFLLGCSALLAFGAFLLSLAGSIVPAAIFAGHSLTYWGIVSWLVAMVFGAIAYGIARSLDL